MNTREKFLSVLNSGNSSQVPEWEFAYWFDTLQNWYKEGLPRKNPPLRFDKQQWVAGEACPGADFFYGEEHYDRDVNEFFGFDERVRGVAVELGPLPLFPEDIFEEDAENIIFRRGDGKVVKTRKDGGSMPHFIEYPVKTAEDFEIIKARFNAEDRFRFPDDWKVYSESYQNRTFPLQLGGGNNCGFYSIIREMAGVEESLFLFHDEPDFVWSMLEFFTDYYIKLYSKVLENVQPDYILIWEDCAFNTGPLVSPAIFREFLLPFYKKFTNSMRVLGVEHFIVDTDGNFEALIPLFIEGGVTGFYPFEVQAGMDIEKTRALYPELLIFGGIDKKVLAGTKEDMDMELAKVERMLKKGRYIPYTDHMVPPDVSFENYKYYRKRLKQIIKNN